MAIQPTSVGRARHRQGIETLGAHIGGEPDAPYVTDPDVFSGMSKQEMALGVSGIDAGVVTEVARAYHSLASTFNITWGLVNLRRIAGGARWEGAAADAASIAIGALMTPVSETSASLQTIGLKLQLAADAAGEVKPRVQSLVSGTRRPPALTGGDAVAAKARDEEERAEAARVLDALYKATLVDSGTNVPPILPPTPAASPPGVLVDEAVGGASIPGEGTEEGTPAQEPISVHEATRDRGGPTAGSSPGRVALTGGGSPRDSEDDLAAETRAATADAHPPGTGAAGTPGTGAVAAGSSQPFAPTNAAGAHAGFGAGTSAAGSPSGGYGPAVRGGTGRASFGSDPGPRGDPGPRRDGPRTGPQGGMPIPGAVLPGPGAGTAPVATAATDLRPGRGRAGPGAAMPIGMAAARARGAEDTEHTTPSYLVTVENGHALIGDIAPVAPPVLGA